MSIGERFLDCQIDMIFFVYYIQFENLILKLKLFKVIENKKKGQFKQIA